MLVINDLFSTIKEARDAINRHVLDEGESYKVYKTDCRRHIIICKNPVCKFRISFASFVDGQRQKESGKMLGIVKRGSVETADRQVIMQGVVQVCLWPKMVVEREHVTGKQLRLMKVAVML
jgi:hypothetical protein